MAASKNSLRLATVNLGLLDRSRETFWLAHVNEYEQRSKLLGRYLGEFLRGHAPDVLFIQELWHDKDAATVRQLAQESGYAALSTYVEKATDFGLEILVRQASFQNGRERGWESVLVQFHDESDSPIQPARERVPCGFNKATGGLLGKCFRRGVLAAFLTTPDGHRMWTGTTHLTSGYSNLEIRKAQLENLAKIVNDAAESAYFLVLGADFNVSPEYLGALPSEIPEWNENRHLYVDFASDTSLLDAYVATHPEMIHGENVGFTQDRRHNDLTRVSPSTKDEPDQRLDFLWVGSRQPGVAVLVEESGFFFDRPLMGTGGETLQLADETGVKRNLYPSDHFGLIARVEVLGGL
jgi:endonuclease/exonuclease/phosphatase family metal-dependent hydrolase